MTQKGYYKIAEAARELNVSVSEVDDLIRSGKMREQVVGTRRLVPAFSVQAILRHRGQVSNTDTPRKKVSNYTENSQNKPGKEIKEKVEVTKGSQQPEVPRQSVSGNNRTYYCPIDDAAERLKKSIGQIRQLILEEKLGSAVFSGERMVLIRDVDRMVESPSPIKAEENRPAPQTNSQTQKQMQQSEALPRPVFGNDSDHYCSIGNTAKRLNKSIGEVRQLIRDAKLRSALFDGERMVLIQDIERFAQASSLFESLKKSPSPQSNTQKEEKSKTLRQSSPDKDNYCTLTRAAQRLNKSINHSPYART